MSISSTEQMRNSRSKPPTASSEPSPKVAYIVSRFPKLTETFVLYEALAMQQLGVNVEIYPLLRHRERAVHAGTERLVERAHFHPFLSLAILRSQWQFARRGLLSYLRLWLEVLRGTWGSANFFIGALGIFPKAVHFAYEMERLGVTHVHAQFATHPAVAGLIIHRLTGIPFSFTARGSDIHVERRMLKQKIEASAFVITVSFYNKNLMTDECGDHVRDKIHVIHGGVDVNLLSPRSATKSAGPLQILCVARFEEVKGHAYLVEACRLLKERGVRFECHLVGEGPLRREVEKQIQRAGLVNEVRLDGACTYQEVIAKLSCADVVVLATTPTRSGKCEGIPNVLKEAMACGLPVVSSSVSGIPELVDDGISGILVPARDVAALADALERLDAEPTLRQRMGKAGREKVVRDFNLRASTARRATLFLAQAEENPARRQEVGFAPFGS